MNFIQSVLGKVVVWSETAFAPTKCPERSAEAQLKVDRETSKYVLYQFAQCPFCLKVRRKVSELRLKIPMRDILLDKKSFDELMLGGGKDQAPCLRIEESPGKFQWLYESSAINALLSEKFK